MADKLLTYPDIHARLIKHFNETMLMGIKVGRCVGYAEDNTHCYVLIKLPD